MNEHNSNQNILKLPQELFNNITDRLPLNHKLKLRLVCKDMKAGKIDIKPKKLYLHGSRVDGIVSLLTSEEQFFQDLRKSIEEVVVLGLCDSEMEEPGTPQEAKMMHRPWPHYDSENSGRPDTFVNLQSVTDEPFQSTYRSLLTGLASLDGLETLGHTGSVDMAANAEEEEAICAVSRERIEAHAKEHEDNTSRFVPTQQEYLERRDRYPVNWAPWTRWWNDIEVIFGILSSSSGKFKHLRFHQPVFCTTYDKWKQLLQGGGNRTSVMLAAGVNVEDLTLTTPGPYDWQTNCAKMLTGMPVLQALSVDLRSAMGFRFRDRSGSFVRKWQHSDRFLVLADHHGYGSSHRLEALTICGDSTLPDCVWVKDMMSLLQRHKQTLKNVTIQNVIFHDSPRMPYVNLRVKDSLREVVRCLSNELSLDTASLAVPRLDAMEQSEESDPPHTKLHTRYTDGRHNWFGLECFEELANEIGVSIGVNGWDFAENIVRQEEDK